MYEDGMGKPITEGDKVKFRGKQYTIKKFLDSKGACETNQIEFFEDQHTEEIADEISVDKI